jgi:hypothetical protein
MTINNPTLVKSKLIPKPGTRWAPVRVGMTYQEILDCGIERYRLRNRISRGDLVFEEALPKAPHWKQQAGGQRPDRQPRTKKQTLLRTCIGPYCRGKKTFRATHRFNRICPSCTSGIARL